MRYWQLGLVVPSALGNVSASPTWSTRPMTGCEARSTPLWVHRNLFWQLSTDGNLHGLGMSHATTASPKPSLGHCGGWVMPWWAEKMLDGQHRRVDSLPMPKLLTMASCRKGWNRIFAESSLMSPRYPTGQGTELNWPADNIHLLIHASPMGDSWYCWQHPSALSRFIHGWYC